MNFELIASAMSNLQRVSGSIEKKRHLKHYGTNIEGFKDILKFIFDPYTRTGLGIRKLEKVRDMYNLTEGGHTPESIMAYLIENNTGSDIAAMYAAEFIEQQVNDEARWLATCLVTQNLQIGCSVKTLNAVYDAGFIPVTGCMLGVLCPTTLPRGNYIATEKLDGNRRILTKRNGVVTLYTRSGHIDKGLVEIEQDAQYLPDNMMFDGELVAEGEFIDSIALRQATASIANATGIRKGVILKLFDNMPIGEYDIGKSLWNSATRKMQLAQMFHDVASIVTLQQIVSQTTMDYVCKITNADTDVISKLQHIQAIPIIGIAHTYEETINLAQPLWDIGKEGIMLNVPTAAYEIKRSNNLLKIKQTKEYILLCIDVLEGDNKYEGKLGAIEVAYTASDGKAYYVRVGSGFSDWQRDEFWGNPDDIVGKMVEIDSFGESSNKTGEYSLNCPIFKRIVGKE